MIVVAVIGLIIPVLVILAALAWGWKHGTLTETVQEQYDRRFDEIVRQW